MLCLLAARDMLCLLAARDIALQWVPFSPERPLKYPAGCPHPAVRRRGWRSGSPNQSHCHNHNHNPSVTLVRRWQLRSSSLTISISP
jgi:hypothetical protein